MELNGIILNEKPTLILSSKEVAMFVCMSNTRFISESSGSELNNDIIL